MDNDKNAASQRAEVPQRCPKCGSADQDDKLEVTDNFGNHPDPQFYLCNDPWHARESVEVPAPAAVEDICPACHHKDYRVFGLCSHDHCYCDNLWHKKRSEAASQPAPAPLNDYDVRPFDKLPEPHVAHVEQWLKSNEKLPSDVRWTLYPIGMVQRWIERAEGFSCEPNVPVAAKEDGAVSGELRQSAQNAIPPVTNSRQCSCGHPECDGYCEVNAPRVEFQPAPAATPQPCHNCHLLGPIVWNCAGNGECGCPCHLTEGTLWGTVSAQCGATTSVFCTYDRGHSGPCSWAASPAPPARDQRQEVFPNSEFEAWACPFFGAGRSSSLVTAARGGARWMFDRLAALRQVPAPALKPESSTLITTTSGAHVPVGTLQPQDVAALTSDTSTVIRESQPD